MYAVRARKECRTTNQPPNQPTNLLAFQGRLVEFNAVLGQRSQDQQCRIVEGDEEHGARASGLQVLGRGDDGIEEGGRGDGGVRWHFRRGGEIDTREQQPNQLKITPAQCAQCFGAGGGWWWSMQWRTQTERVVF